MSQNWLKGGGILVDFESPYWKMVNFIMPMWNCKKIASFRYVRDKIANYYFLQLQVKLEIMYNNEISNRSIDAMLLTEENKIRHKIVNKIKNKIKR